MAALESPEIATNGAKAGDFMKGRKPNPTTSRATLPFSCCLSNWERYEGLLGIPPQDVVW